MTDVTRERSLEQVVSEQEFAPLLSSVSQDFFELAASLIQARKTAWSKRQLFMLCSEADELESFLDDYGARRNGTFAPLTEWVASTRGFAMAGLSLEHLMRRMAGYKVLDSFSESEAEEAQKGVSGARAFVQEVLVSALEAIEREASRLGVNLPPRRNRPLPSAVEAVRILLPQDLGQEQIEEEQLRIAEVSSKYLQACTMLDEVGIRRESDPLRRTRFLAERCSEARARVYEATVHNLQSTYDTHIKNTVLEAGDERLQRLRGHISASLHCLEAVTQFAHFIERHESDARGPVAGEDLAEIVPRQRVEEVLGNQLLYWANRFLQQGRGLAEDLLPHYTNLQTLVVEVPDDLVVHARPASLIVSIANYYGMPIEVEIEGRTANAASILELMVLVGSHPDARRYLFRGDERPLRDIATLFENGLGEQGVDSLPESLGYLRGGA